MSRRIRPCAWLLAIACLAGPVLVAPSAAAPPPAPSPAVGEADPEDLWPSAGNSSLKPGDDREELRRLIREELRAEKDTESSEDGDSTSETKASRSTSEESSSSTYTDRPSLDGVWNRGFVAESADKDFRIHIGGRLDWDNGWFKADDNLLMGNNPPVQLEDGSAMRRARFRADGTLYGWIDFVTEVNFATIQDVSNVENDAIPVGSVGLTDFHLTFRELPLIGNLRAGHFVAPYSLERYTSANVFYYMERSPMHDAFYGPNQRQSGLMAFDSYFDDRMTLAGSFTRVGKSTMNSLAFNAEDGLYAGGIRATILPAYVDEGKILLHVGGSYFRQGLDDNQSAVANRFLIRAGGGSEQVPNILATGTFFSPEKASVANAEMAMVLGPLSVSAEYAYAWLPNVFGKFDGTTFSDPRGDANYHAAYVEAGFFVTPGDHRSYDRKTGTWSRTIPKRSIRLVRTCDGDSYRTGYGALQLLARFTWLDLVSGSPTLTPTTGGARAGRERDLTTGFNWYLNPQTILSLNYVYTHLDSVVAGASGNIQGIGTRLHFDF